MQRPLAAFFVTVLPALAQVPDGAYVTASFQVGAFGGPAGIWVVERDTGFVVPITGLPPEITGAAYPSAVVLGANLVQRRASDGALVATGFASGVTNVQAPLFFLTLTGTAVTTTVRYDLGLITSPTARGVTQAHVLGDGRVVVAIDEVGTTGEPLDGAILGVVDQGIPNGSPGAVSAIPVAPVPAGFPNGIAVDEAAGTVYLGMVQANQPSEVWSVPLAGGSPQLVTTVPATITNMAIGDGEVLVVCSGGSGIFRVDPGLGTATPFTTITNFNAVAFERATGDIVAVRGAPNPVLMRIDPAGGSTTVSGGPVGGWGTVSGVDIDHDPEPYGDDTPGANTYAWRVLNGGGVPRIGNLAFRIEVTAEPAAPILTGIVATTAPAPVPLTILGMEVVVDPAAQVVSFVGAGATTFTQGLPLRNDASLVGVQFFFQSFHVEPGNLLASSNGLAMTILP